MKLNFSIILVIACLTFGHSQQKLNVLGKWSDPTLPGSFQYNNTYNEVWGYAIDGFEYAIIGSTMGTHIIDVTNPSNIFEHTFIPGSSQGGHIVHRDYHDYMGYLYAVSDESSSDQKSTLQIIDISNLPNEVTVVYDSKDIIERAHNIFIDEEAGRLYACSTKGGDSAYKGLKYYDLSDPLDPIKLGQKTIFDGEAFSHAHDAYAKNNLVFLNCGPDGLFVIDFTIVDEPILKERLTPNDYPEAGYNHSGWPTDDLEYYYFADENHGSDMKIMKTNNFQGTEIVGTFNAGNDDPFSIPHNQIVHNGFLYVSYYYDGLQVYDLKNPEAPERVGYYPTSNIPKQGGYEGAWGVYPFLPSGNILVSDMQEGLFVVENVGGVVAVENQEYVDFKVYPNPSNGVFNIEIDDELDFVQVKDLQGRDCNASFTLDSRQVSLQSDLADGFYLLQVSTKGQLLTKKIAIFK